MFIYQHAAAALTATAFATFWALEVISSDAPDDLSYSGFGKEMVGYHC